MTPHDTAFDRMAPDNGGDDSSINVVGEEAGHMDDTTDGDAAASP